MPESQIDRVGMELNPAAQLVLVTATGLTARLGRAGRTGYNDNHATITAAAGLAHPGHLPSLGRAGDGPAPAAGLYPYL